MKLLTAFITTQTKETTNSPASESPSTTRSTTMTYTVPASTIIANQSPAPSQGSQAAATGEKRTLAATYPYNPLR